MESTIFEIQTQKVQFGQFFPVLNLKIIFKSWSQGRFGGSAEDDHHLYLLCGLNQIHNVRWCSKLLLPWQQTTAAMRCCNYPHAVSSSAISHQCCDCSNVTSADIFIMIILFVSGRKILVHIGVFSADRAIPLFIIRCTATNNWSLCIIY